MQKSKILIISSANPLKGPGVLAIDMYKALKAADVEVDLLTQFPIDGHPEYLYVEKKLVEYDVSIVERTLKDGRILYYLDDDDNIGSYYCWKNGKKEKVSDDVYHGLLAVANRGVDSDENLLYCKNYDEDDEVWDLYVYKGNKEVKVGYDVSLMFTVDKSEKYHDVLSMSTVRSWFD